MSTNSLLTPCKQGAVHFSPLTLEMVTTQVNITPPAHAQLLPSISTRVQKCEVKKL